MQPAYQAYLVGFIFVVFFTFAGAAFPTLLVTKLVLVILASLAFAIGFLVWSWPMVRKSWAHPAGRILIVILNLIVLIFAAILARNVVASALGLPPQDFDISVSFMALLFYVPAWSIVLSIVLGISSIFLYFIGLMAGTIDHTGKKTIKLLGHSMGAFAICFFSYSGFDLINRNETYLYSVVKWVAFFGDFQNANKYPNIAASERVRLHENGVISSATVENNEVVIRVRKEE